VVRALGLPLGQCALVVADRRPHRRVVRIPGGDVLGHALEEDLDLLLGEASSSYR
jgi:hypothetical protein